MGLTVALLAGGIAWPGDIAFAQASGRAHQEAPRDSASRAAIESHFAVATSGVWTMDGEYKGPTGIYYKLTGYLAYVSSTSTSQDSGDAAVIAMYLEPLAGGTPTWISARLYCGKILQSPEARCLAAQGATQLLDLNFTIRNLPFRGMRAEAEITEPDDKNASNRFTGRSTTRGKFSLVPVSR